VEDYSDIEGEDMDKFRELTTNTKEFDLLKLDENAMKHIF